MLFIILIMAVLVGVSLVISTSNKNNIEEFNKLENKKDGTKNYKFCC